MKTKKTSIKLFSNLLLATLLAASASIYAAGAGDAQITVYASGLSVSAPGTANVTSLMLRVAAPDDSVSELKSDGSALDWSAAGMADGYYRYEAYVKSTIAGSDKTETTITRGRLNVFQGIIMQGNTNDAGGRDERSSNLFNGLKEELKETAGNLLEMLVPNAQAQDLTASSSFPSVIFQDSMGGTGNDDWYVDGIAEDPTSPMAPGSAYFRINDDVDDVLHDDVTVFRINHSVNNSNSFLVDDNGDVSLANDSFFFDRSSKRMGINTTTPARGIHVLATSSKSSMALRMENTAESTWDIGQSSLGDYFISIIANGNGGPTGTMFAINDNNGYTGMGTAAPTAKLTVKGNSTTSEDVQVLVHNTDTTSAGVAKTLFSIKNDNGPAKFLMTPNTTGDSWAFNALANEFRISKQGTGVREFTVKDNGDIVASGTVVHASSRTVKHDIVNVDSQAVLNKVLAMPIAKWTYNRDAKDGIRHIGPMAEDFYQAFGLGSTDKGIALSDSSGVALAAIKGLNEVVKQKNAKIVALEQNNAEMSDRMAKLESLVSSLVAKDKLVMNQ